MAHIGFKSRVRRSGGRATRSLAALLALSASFVAMAQTNEPTEDKASAVSTSFEELVQMMVDADMTTVQEAVDGGYAPPTPPE